MRAQSVILYNDRRPSVSLTGPMDTNPLLTDREIAEVLRMGIALRIFSNAAAIEWAQARLAESSEPDEWLIELVTSTEALVPSVLREYGREPSPRAVEILIGLVHRLVEENPHHAPVLANRLWALAQSTQLPSWVSDYAEAFELAHSGVYSNTQAVRESFLHDLAPFRASTSLWTGPPPSAPH